MVRHAKDLSTQQRLAIESLLGRSIAEEESISVTVVGSNESETRSLGLTSIGLSREEWIDSFKAWALSHASYNLPVLSDDAMSRESIYSDCD